MMKMNLNKKNIAKYIAIFSIAFLIGLCFHAEFRTTQVYYKLYEKQIIVNAGKPTEFSLTFDLTGWLRFYQNGKLSSIEELGSAMTKIGINLTMAKLTGNTTIGLVSDYLYNLTYIALGTDVGLTTSSTVLPNEWNRTSGDQVILENGARCNLTATIYPSGSGSTNATSVNWKSGIGTDNSMIFYDTFTTKDYTSNDHFEIEWSWKITYT